MFFGRFQRISALTRHVGCLLMTTNGQLHRLPHVLRGLCHGDNSVVSARRGQQRDVAQLTEWSSNLTIFMCDVVKFNTKFINVTSGSSPAAGEADVFPGDVPRRGHAAGQSGRSRR